MLKAVFSHDDNNDDNTRVSSHYHAESLQRLSEGTFPEPEPFPSKNKVVVGIMNITIKLMEVDGEFIATCPELDINCYAHNKKEAIRRIVTVLRFYIDSAKELGFEVADFDSISIEGSTTNMWFMNKSLIHKSDSIN
jgi:hypothetical protein